MFVLAATLQVKPEHREAFFEAQVENARASVRDEPGCVRFEVLVDAFDPNRMHIYEVFRDQAGLDAHLVAPHYARFREKVMGWFAAPLPGAAIIHYGVNVFPTDDAWE